MRLEAHENMMVWSIHQTLYGPGRMHHTEPDAAVRALGRASGAIDRYEPALAVRVVPTPGRPEPMACRPYGGTETPSPHTPTSPFLTSLSVTDLITVPAGLAPAMQPGALQGYFQGQAVPTASNLLDVVA